jgi:hypothetical protein
MIINAALDGPTECAADPAKLDFGRGELCILRRDSDVTAHRGFEPPPNA